MSASPRRWPKVKQPTRPISSPATSPTGATLRRLKQIKALKRGSRRYWTARQSVPKSRSPASPNLPGFSEGGLVGGGSYGGIRPRASSAPYFDLRGAVTTQDLINQMNAIGSQAEGNAKTWATKNVPAVTQSKTVKQQQHQIGRRKR